MSMLSVQKKKIRVYSILLFSFPTHQMSPNLICSLENISILFIEINIYGHCGFDYVTVFYISE